MRLSFLFMAFATLSAASAATQETPATRAARYYAEGLERPLLQLRAGAQLVQACVDRLKRACDEDQHELAEGTYLIDLLNALTLFPQRPTNDAARFTRARDLEARLAANDAALIREAADYDLMLFARYGAALRACPPEDGAAEFHASLAALVEL